MKKLVISLIVSMIAISSHAFLYINWATPSGFTYGPGTADTPLFTSPTITALFQLIHSSDNIPGDPSPGSGLPDGDTVLQEFNMTATIIGDDYGMGFSQVYGPAPFIPGYVYLRVFEAGTSIGNVPVGARFFTGPLYVANDNPAGPNVPDSVREGPINEGPGFEGAYILNQVVVPEPATLAILALGGAVVAIRRKIRA